MLSVQALLFLLLCWSRYGFEIWALVDFCLARSAKVGWRRNSEQRWAEPPVGESSVTFCRFDSISWCNFWHGVGISVEVGASLLFRCFVGNFFVHFLGLAVSHLSLYDWSFRWPRRPSGRSYEGLNISSFFVFYSCFKSKFKWNFQLLEEFHRAHQRQEMRRLGLANLGFMVAMALVLESVITF